MALKPGPQACQTCFPLLNHTPNPFKNNDENPEHDRE